jgi:hypothetical protein
LAYRNRGRSQAFDELDEIQDRLPKFFGQLNDAYLVNLEADFGRVNRESVFPRALPDFYKGQVVTLYGRFEPGQDRDLVVRLDGRAGASEREMVLRADFDAAVPGTSDIAKKWAFEKTYHLISEVSKLGETPELMGEIRRLNQEYGVRTSYSDQ